MRRLVLFRHAKAERQAASGQDIDRALTERGQADARLIGGVLAQAGVRPDLALVSSAQRTRQTWEAAAEAFPPCEARFEEPLYNAGASGLRKAIDAAAPEFETIVVVGHNPGLHQLALALLIEGGGSGAVLERVTGKFPTACAIVYDLDAAERPQYAGFYLPKDYGGGAED